MKSLPDAMFVVDTVEEETAVREAAKLSIPIIGIVDTNSDPKLIDYPIPGNDDAIRSINLFSRTVAEAIEIGRKIRGEGRDVEMAEAAAGQQKATASLEGVDSVVTGTVPETKQAATEAEAAVSESADAPAPDHKPAAGQADNNN